MFQSSNLGDIGLGAIDSIKSVSISNVYQLASDYPNQYVTFSGSISNLPVSGNYRYIGHCLRVGKYTQVTLVNMETYTVYQNYNRGYDSGGQWSGWSSNVTNADMGYYINGVKAGKVIWYYETDSTGPFLRLTVDNKNIAFFRVSGTYSK